MRFYIILLNLIQFSVLNGSIVPLEGNPINGAVVNNMNQPTIDQAKELAWYASAAVCTEKQLKDWKCKACKKTGITKFIKQFKSLMNINSAYLSVNIKDKYFILSFRGTKNAANGIGNANTGQSKFDAIDEPEARVHSGFLNAMESLSKDFIKELGYQLNLNKEYKIVVTGHSLGGSIASLAAIKIHKELNIGWDQIELYTYGQPRVGNRKFAEWFNSKPITAARVVNFNDAVPHNPAASISTYTHHGNELFIPDKESGKEAHFCNKNVYEDPDCSYSISSYAEKAHYNFFDTYTGEEAAC